MSEKEKESSVTGTSQEAAVEEDEVDGVTMVDVLKEEEALEEDAAAVLGNVSDSKCSYSSGYLPRQPLYACQECAAVSQDKDDSSPKVGVGVCLACSYHCHEGCNLVELYTKRNFRCDCGTEKMKRSCKLEPNKEANIRNKYNQNFSGLYCTCHRPYPDPDDPVDDLMIQCIVCEDWFHGRHLNMPDNKLPDEDLYAEMICFQCVGKLDFLKKYQGLAITVVKKDTDENASKDVDVTQNSEDSKKSGSTSTSSCNLLPKDVTESSIVSSMFLPEDWRLSLSKDPESIRMYRDLRVEFLTDIKDTVQYYETQSKTDTKNTMEHGMEALSRMDRIKQVEAIHSYNNMKQNLMDYLSKFADNKKVVREEDIKEFFENMKNKKARISGPPPSNCK